MMGQGTYDLKCGRAEDDAMYPTSQVDLILGDWPFKPKIQQYTQVRKQNQTNLTPIFTPSTEEYDEWVSRCCDIWRSNLKPSGYLVLKCDDYTARETYHILSQSFTYSYTVIWNKLAIGLGRKIRKQHEVLEIYVPKNAKKSYWSQKSLSKTSNHGGSQGVAFRSIIDCLAIRNGFRGKRLTQKHINQTPFELWLPFLTYMCPKNGIVLDPFMGSGSILQAILKLNRLQKNSYAYWGIECDSSIFSQTLKDLLPGPNALDHFIGVNTK